MFDANYYQNKKAKLNEKRAIRQQRALAEVTNLLNSFWADMREMEERMTEIQQMEAESKKKVEKKTKRE